MPFVARRSAMLSSFCVLKVDWSWKKAPYADDEVAPRPIDGFSGIINGDYDHLPEAAFYMVGTIEEAVEKGKKMTQEAA